MVWYCWFIILYILGLEAHSVLAYFKMKVKVAQSCSTLCDPMDGSLPGSSVHGILQARILEWLAIPFSRRSSQLRDRIQVSRIACGFFTVWTREGEAYFNFILNLVLCLIGFEYITFLQKHCDPVYKELFCNCYDLSS